MSPASIDYGEWRETCDTIHAHTQVLGKIAVALAPPEPQLQHGALRLTARGWETAPLPRPDGGGALVVALDLHRGEAIVETSDGGSRVVSLSPDRPVGEATREVLAACEALAGAVKIDPTPQEVDWKQPLDVDTEHARWDAVAVAAYFEMASAAAAALGAFAAPFRGRRTPVNAWWGSFDLSVNLFSGEPAAPPADDFIMRNAMDAQEFAFGWWPGDARYEKPAFYVYAHPATEGFAGAELPGPGRWSEELGEYVLDFADVATAADPRGVAVEFALAAFQHTCEVCSWDPKLGASAAGEPPPLA